MLAPKVDVPVWWREGGRIWLYQQLTAWPWGSQSLGMIQPPLGEGFGAQGVCVGGTAVVPMYPPRLHVGSPKERAPVSLSPFLLKGFVRSTNKPLGSGTLPHFLIFLSKGFGTPQLQPLPQGYAKRKGKRGEVKSLGQSTCQVLLFENGKGNYNGPSQTKLGNPLFQPRVLQ